MAKNYGVVPYITIERDGQGKQIYVLAAERLHASDTYNLGYALRMDPYDNSERGL
jgi:hypothetical protein